MLDRPNIRQEALDALLDEVADPRRLGGHVRALRLAGRMLGRDIKTFRELEDLFSAMLEEEAASLLADIRARMPDLTTNTVLSTVRRMPEAA